MDGLAGDLARGWHFAWFATSASAPRRLRYQDVNPSVAFVVVTAFEVYFENATPLLLTDEDEAVAWQTALGLR